MGVEPRLNEWMEFRGEVRLGSIRFYCILLPANREILKRIDFNSSQKSMILFVFGELKNSAVNPKGAKKYLHIYTSIKPLIVVRFILRIPKKA